MESFDPGGDSGHLFSPQVCKSMQFSLEGLKLGWLTNTSANMEDRVLHCTSQATQDFIAKAAAFGLLTEFNGTGTSHRIRFPDAANRTKLEKIQVWKEKNVQMLDLSDITQKSCDSRFDQFCRTEMEVESCDGNVVITCAKEYLESVEAQTSENIRLLQGIPIQSALVRPSQASSPSSSKDCIICTTATSSSTQTAGTCVVLKDRLSFVGNSFLSATDGSLSPEIEAPSTPDLGPEVKFLECKMAIPDCTDHTISGECFPEEQKCSLQPGGFEGTYKGQKGASHLGRQYGGILPDNILFRLDETVVRIQKVYRGFRIRKYCSQMHSAAISIQTCYRRWKVQKEYCSLKAIVLRMQAKVKGKQLHMQYQHLRQAALFVQRVWRFHRRLRKKNHLQQVEFLREKACTTIQAHVRRYKARFMLDQWHRAAAEIQHTWRDYQQKKHFKVEKMNKDGAAQFLQSRWQSFCVGRKAKGEYIEMSVQEQAVIVLQAFTRGYLVRKRFSLRRPGTPVCQSVRQLDLKTSNNGAHLALPVMEVCFNNAKLPEPVNDVFSRLREGANPGSIGLYNIPGSCTNQDSGVKQVHACIFETADHCHNSEQCRAPSFAGVEGKDFEKKLDDWNDIPTDHLDECLDTCLAYMRPLPSSLCSGDWNLSHVRMTNESITTAGLYPQRNSTSAMLEQARGIYNHLEQQAPEIYPACLSSEIKELSKPKDSICQRQNKEKLEHFAEVFLLHRHIVQQQRRAQDAPPFSPDITLEVACGKSSGSTLHTCIESVQPKGKFRRVNAKTASHQGTGPFFNLPSSVTEASSKLVEVGIGRVPGDDVVVDIVGLLDHIQKACLATQPHDKVIHIDEDWYQTNTYTMAAAKFCDRTLTSSLSGQLVVVPKVRAVLIVVFAMVVYTKMLCHGALVWAGRPQRNNEKK